VEKSKYSTCESNEYVVLISAGNKVGEMVDESRSLYKCNKCDKEFNG